MATRTCLLISSLSLFFMQSTYSIHVSNQLFRGKRSATQLKSQTFKKISISLECISSNTIASTAVVPNPVTHLKYGLFKIWILIETLNYKIYVLEWPFLFFHCEEQRSNALVIAWLLEHVMRFILIVLSIDVPY